MASELTDKGDTMRIFAIVVCGLCILVSGCCIDPDRNAAMGNIITYEGNRVCTDSTQRGLNNAVKICGRLCPKEKK